MAFEELRAPSKPFAFAMRPALVPPILSYVPSSSSSLFLVPLSESLSSSAASRHRHHHKHHRYLHRARLPLTSTGPAMTADSELSAALAHRRGAGARWVDTARVHHALLANHFLDVVDVCEHSFPRDGPVAYAARMRGLSIEFRRQVLGSLVRRLGLPSTLILPVSSGDPSPLAERTATAVAARTPLIINPVLALPDVRVFARPPALLRVDAACDLLGLVLDAEQADYVLVAIKRRPVLTAAGSTSLKRGQLDRLHCEAALWIDIARAGKHGVIADEVAVVGLCNGRKRSVVYGAFPAQEDGLAFDSTVWKAASMIPAAGTLQRGVEAVAWRARVVDEATNWLKHTDVGDAKQIEEDPIVALARNAKHPYFRPNMKVTDMYDWPWARAKRAIATTVGELTLVSGVSNNVVSDLLLNGTGAQRNDFRDETSTFEALALADGITAGSNRQFTAAALRMLKPTYEGPTVVPDVILDNRCNWRLLRDHDGDAFFHGAPGGGERMPNGEKLSFYVDFELVSPDALYTVSPSSTASSPSSPTTTQCDNDSNDKEASELQYQQYIDYTGSAPPPENAAEEGGLHRRTDALIFLIGCGRLVDGVWDYHAFTAPDLSLSGERAVVREWLQHMRDTIATDGAGTAATFVWGPEAQLLRKALGRMPPKEQAQMQAIVNLRFVNMLAVASAAHLCVRGTTGQAAKHMAHALQRNGLVTARPVHTTNNDDKENSDSDTIHGGMDVMAAALVAVESLRDSSSEETHRKIQLRDAPAMRDIRAYNEADCWDIAAITNYLRDNH